VADRIDQVRVLLTKRGFILATPSWRALREVSKPKANRILNEAHVHAAAAVKAAPQVAVIKIVNDSADRHALEFVQRVLEQTGRRSVTVEHQKLSDFAARVCQAVREQR